MTEHLDHPDEETVRNILAAAGWSIVKQVSRRSDATHAYLVSPQGLRFMLPDYPDRTTHATAWEYYLSLNNIAK